MNDFKADMTVIQSLAAEAFTQTGALMAYTDMEPAKPGQLAKVLEKTLNSFETAVIEMRNLCEKHYPRHNLTYPKRKTVYICNGGDIEVTDKGWVHITINSLLPHSRFLPPAYLSDTIAKLIYNYAGDSKKLPYFEKALLVIEEHCNIKTRWVFDHDNKGYKVISNILKGKLFLDDDQFHMSLLLLSHWAETPLCHVFVLPEDEGSDFFLWRKTRGGIV